MRNRKGELWDIQLKGAGKTPYSRFGDGRAVMRSTIREYLCSEAMAALDIPTSRALAIVATGETVRRETARARRGADAAGAQPYPLRPFRAFPSIAAASTKCKLLADHVIGEYFPDFAGDYAGWFGEVVKRTAELMADWQAVGFAHGVMNTDNMSILGLTLDYGPFGFMDAYDPGFVCNHTDEQGRYCFDNQPSIAHWNLRALAVALSGLIPTETLVEQLERLRRAFRRRTTAPCMRAKFGLGARWRRATTS